MIRCQSNGVRLDCERGVRALVSSLTPGDSTPPRASFGNVDPRDKNRWPRRRRPARRPRRRHSIRDSVKRLVCDILWRAGRATGARGLRSRCSRIRGIVVLWGCNGPEGDQKRSGVVVGFPNAVVRSPKALEGSTSHRTAPRVPRAASFATVASQKGRYDFKTMQRSATNTEFRILKSARSKSATPTSILGANKSHW